VLTKLHGEGNPDSELVKYQFKEIETALATENDNMFNWMPLVADRASRSRFFVVICVSMFGQWSGNAAISYYFIIMLDQAGITDQQTRLLLNALQGPIAFVFNQLSNFFLVDKIGRRKLLIFGWFGLGMIYVAITIVLAVLQQSFSLGLAYLFVGIIYVYNIWFSICITPMLALYAVENLSYANRGRGMAAASLAVNIAGTFNNYVTNIVVGAISWKWYLVYIAWDMFETAISVKFFPETKGWTLEEIDDIYESPNPVKASLRPRSPKGEFSDEKEKPSE